MIKDKFGNNQDTRNNNQTITNNQIPIIKQKPMSVFGDWLLEIEICLVIVSWLLVIFALPGCGYTTKSLLPVHIKTVYVENFKNSIDVAAEVSSKKPYRLYAPGLENEITRAIVDRFILDGNLKVVKDPDMANSILSGQVLEYTREPLRYDESQDVTEYRVRVVASMKFLDKKDNKIIWEANSFSGESSQRTQGALEKSEEKAREEAISDLARRVIEKTIEVW